MNVFKATKAYSQQGLKRKILMSCTFYHIRKSTTHSFHDSLSLENKTKARPAGNQAENSLAWGTRVTMISLHPHNNPIQFMWLMRKRRLRKVKVLSHSHTASGSVCSDSALMTGVEVTRLYSYSCRSDQPEPALLALRYTYPSKPRRKPTNPSSMFGVSC